MIENGKINSRQFMILVFLFTVGTNIINAPSGLAEAAKQDAWIAAVLGVVVSFGLIYLYSVLAKQCTQNTLFELNEILLGKWLGKSISVLYFIYFFLLCGILLRIMGDFMATQILVQTPIQAIHILFLIPILFGTRLGLEVLARGAEIFLPWIIVLFLMLVILLTPEVDIKKIQPVMAEGFKPILKATFPFLGLPFLELIIFLMITPYVNKSKKVGRAFLLGTLLGGLVLIVTVLMSLLVLGPNFTARHIYPTYVLAKKINIGDFLTRIEAILAGVWFLSIMIKLNFCFYASTIGLAQIFELKDYRVLVFPLAIITVVLSMILVPNTSYMNMFIVETWTPFSLTFGLFFPVVLLIVGTYRKRSKKGKS